MSVTMSEVASSAVKGMIAEVSGAMTRIEGERELIKEAIKKVADDHDLDKKVLKQLARIYHKQIFHTIKADNETVEETYSFLFEKSV